MSPRPLFYLLVIATCVAGSLAQQCQPSTGILKLARVDQSCADFQAVQECISKMQMTVSQMCSIQVQPDLPVAADGTFCSPSRGVQQRDMAGGKLLMGRSDLDFLMRPHAPSGMILMNLKGRFVPPTGGREYPVECNMLMNVTGGSVLGIVSAGSDTLMSTTVQPSLAGGGYSGAALPGQQNGVNGVMGPQAESGKEQTAAKKSSAVLSGPAGKAVACMAAVLGLLLPALL